MWRVLHISDTHAGANAHGDPLERLETVLGAVAADGFSPDLVVHTGDISDAGQASDVEAVLDRLAGVAPVLAVPGNHDDPATVTLTEAGLGPWRVIGIDTTRLTTVVLDHLLACGARRIALISGTDPNEWCLTSVECYRRWTSEHGLSCQVAEASEERGDAGGRAAVDEILAAARDANEMPPDAYYCLTAAQARGVCTRLHELGVRVPFDVQVIAGSDSERSRAASPSITAVDLEPELLGRRAVTTMLAILRSEELPTHPTGVGRLAVRDSTLPPLPRHEASTG